MPSSDLIFCCPLLLLPTKCLVGCKFWVLIVLVPKPHGATPCEQPRREVLSGSPKPHGATPCEQPRREVLSGERGLEPRLLTPGQLPGSVSLPSVKFQCLYNCLDTIVVSRIMLVVTSPVDLCSQLQYLPSRAGFSSFLLNAEFLAPSIAAAHSRCSRNSY